MWRRSSAFGGGLIAALALSGPACARAGSASDEECAALGDKYVELFMAEQTEDGLALGVEVLASAAAAGREQVIAQCKSKRTSRATVERCLVVTSMAEFRSC